MKRLHEMRTDGGSLLAGLFDRQFTTVITTQMVPTIYTLGQLLSGIATVYVIFWAFQQSLISGAVWLCLLGPAMFLALIVTIRVLLEFVLTVFRIAFFLEALGGQIETIASQAEEIHEDLPRIRFWRRPRDNGR
ncbi:DUF4282 domain-containing protein [Endozoicomonas sp. G2_2]|uniref:DUF4282 domain-containing protein n=1 Tax=Endozoicomonas sp. G2_2 TaxID=2821092 RepID=UPI001ADCB3FC|nr:DUF4282 domain-containing protein [Endozoicomonas sp. G2_2]MBO9470022.1 DUF4282 domain-containing protein [Endozoicomonas sp. G2_2]